MPRYQERIGDRDRDDEYRFGWREDERDRRSFRDHGPPSDRGRRYARYDEHPRYGAMDRSYDEDGRIRQRRDDHLEDRLEDRLEDPYEYDDRGVVRYDHDDDRYERMDRDDDYDRDHFNIEEDDRAGRVWRSSGGRGAMDQRRMYDRSREYNRYGYDRDRDLRVRDERDRYLDDRERYLRERERRESYARRESTPGRDSRREVRGYTMGDQPQDRRGMYGYGRDAYRDDYGQRRERGPYRPGRTRMGGR